MTRPRPADGAATREDDAALAAALVRDAAGLATRLRAGGLEAETKTSVSDLVTAADRGAERLIVDRLAEVRPDDGIVGEEGSARTSRSGRTWVIDPVDGTYNFVAGLPWWCCALALTDAEDLLLGAIHDPLRDRTLVGGPAWATRADGAPLAQLRDVALAETCVATYLHPPWHDGPVGAAWRRVIAGVSTWRNLGSSSLDAVAVAEGRLGAVVQHSLPPWDALPGSGLIRGAGGEVRRVEAAGVAWHVAGAPTAVAQICRALVGHTPESG